MSSERCGGSENLHGYEVLALEHDARLVFDFALHHMAEHAFSRIIEMAQSFVQAMTHLAWDYWRGDQLGVRMLQASPGIRTVILEDGNVVDALVAAERIVPLLLYSQNSRDVLVRQ